MPYLQNATHEGFIFDETRKAEFAGNGTHAAMAMQYFVANLPTGQLNTNNQPIYANYNIGQAVGFYSSKDANLTEVYANPLKLAISTKETELSNVTVWTGNSILTQGRGNSLYIADSTVLTGVPMSYGNDIFYGHYQTRGPAPGFPFVAGSLFTGSAGIVGIANAADPCNIEFLPGDTFNRMRFRSYNQSLLFAQDGFIAETGTANWTWTANSILTQGRGDARYYFANNPTGYITAAYLTYGNISGTPNLSLYLTTANAASTYLPSANFSFSNLTGKPTTLSGYGITDGLTSATAASTYQTISGMSSYLTISSAASTYLPAANFTWGNLTGKPTFATVATSGNYNDLSNKPASYTLPAATNTTLGGVIVGANLSVSANGTLSANIPAGSGGGFANGDILNGGTF